MISNFSLCIIATAVVTLSLVYAPQPLTPTFVQYFNISSHNASLVVSLALLPLAIAPLFYGYLLEKYSAKYIIIISLFSCAIIQLISSFINNFSLFLILRFVQSLFFPAILTTLLTILTRQKTDIQKNVSLYVGATIAGGLIGRVLGSYLSSAFSWQFALNFFAFLMLCCGMWFAFINDSKPTSMRLVGIRNFLPFLARKRFLIIFISAFCMFFSFQAILSTLPFAFKDSSVDIRDVDVGLLYIGYLMGMVVSFFAHKITQWLSGRLNAIIIGFILFALGILVMSSLHFYIVFWAMFLFCTGSFMAHCLLSALLNSLSSRQKGITNGLYLAFYYSGGVMGSYLPNFYYDIFGWKALCYTISILLCSVSFIIFINRRLY